VVPHLPAAAGDGPGARRVSAISCSSAWGEEDDRVRLYKGFETGRRHRVIRFAAYNCAVWPGSWRWRSAGRPGDGHCGCAKPVDRVPNAQFWYGRGPWSRDEALTAILARRAADGFARARPKPAWAEAQVALGEMMLTGTGGACDPQGALALFEKAAANGDLTAMFCKPPSSTQAVTACRQMMLAAQQLVPRKRPSTGHPAAQMMLERYGRCKRWRQG